MLRVKLSCSTVRPGFQQRPLCASSVGLWQASLLDSIDSSATETVGPDQGVGFLSDLIGLIRSVILFGGCRFVPVIHFRKQAKPQMVPIGI